MSFITDTFTDTAGINLTAHTGETGAGWAKHPSFAGDQLISDANRIRCNSSAAAVYYASGAPASADYTLTADLVVKSVVNSNAGIIGRIDAAADTFYWARYAKSATVAQWQLQKDVAGVNTTLGTFDQALSAGQTYKLQLKLVGAAIELLVDEVSRIAASDSAITSAGKAGVRSGIAVTNITGFHLDNFDAADAAAAAAAVSTGSGWLTVVRLRRLRRSLLKRMIYWRSARHR